MSRVDVLIMHIDRVLAECDARALPPLASGPAAAVLDLTEQAGLTLTPWQESTVRAMYADQDVELSTRARQMVNPPSRPHRLSRRGPSADQVIVDELVDWDKQAGMCGNEAPRVVPGGERTWCELAHGHAGWHRCGGQSWSADEPKQ